MPRADQGLRGGSAGRGRQGDPDVVELVTCRCSATTVTGPWNRCTDRLPAVATVPLTGSERAHPIRNNYGDNLRDLADDPIRDAMMAS